ncbi:MAG: hypothetical protein RBR15_14990 [Sphaerochaeta sp.]|nr:hypothetical protein [Sphaerochaeta sp.]
MKDTCCNLELLKTRVDVIRGTQLKLSNANAVLAVHVEPDADMSLI